MILAGMGNETWKFSQDKADQLTVFLSLSLSLTHSLSRLIWSLAANIALMEVQQSSEPDLAAQHCALQFSAQRTGTEHSQS